MIKESIVELINAIADGDSLGIEDSFNTVMASKISDRLDSMRVDVAQDMFKESVFDDARKKQSDDEKKGVDPDKEYKLRMKSAQNTQRVNKALTKEEVELEELTLEDYSLEELEDFMMSEDFEQLDELSRKTLSSYLGKARSSQSNVMKDLYKSPEGSAERDKNRKTANNRTDGKERAIDTLRGKTNKDRAKKGLPTRYYTEEIELDEAVTASQLIANHNSSDHGGAQHFSNVDGKQHSWNYVKKNKEGTKYEVTTDKGEAEGIAHKGKFLKLKK
jgi:hypothetical protein